MRLTSIGERFLERCNIFLSDFESAKEEVKSSQSDLSGRLTITAPLSFGLHCLSAALNEFMAANTSIIVNLMLSDEKTDIIDSPYDLAIRIGRLSDSTLIARKLIDIRHVVCGSPDFFDKHFWPRTPKDLSKLQALCYGNIKRPGTWIYSEKGESERAVKVPVRMISNNGDVLLGAAIDGLGVICEPEFIVRQAINNKQVSVVLNEFNWNPMELYVVYPCTRKLSLKARALVDHLISYFEKNRSE